MTNFAKIAKKKFPRIKINGQSGKHEERQKTRAKKFKQKQRKKERKMVRPKTLGTKFAWT